MRDRRRWSAGLLLITGGVAYAGVVPEAAAGWPLGLEQSYLSEMAAADQPHSGLFRTADVFAGLAILIAATLSLRPSATHRLGQVPRATLIALGVFGAATVADALFPMDCAVSLPGCAAAEAAGALSTAHTIHSVTSALAGAAVVAASVVLLLPLMRRRTSAPREATDPVGIAAPGAWTSVCAAGIILTLTAQTVSHLAGGPPLGSVQRIQVVLVCLLLIALGSRVLRSAAGAAR